MEGLKIRVTLVRMPWASSLRAAATPAWVQGILMTKLGDRGAIFRASATISSASSRWGLISTETGNLSTPSRPSSLIHSAISVMQVMKGLPLTMM